MLDELSDDPRSRWDRRYAAAPAAWPGPADPHPWLQEHSHRVPRRGRGLGIAAGLGRNALWLARRGVSVVAVDASTVACGRLRDYAAAEALEIHVIERDLEREPLPPGPFDVVVNTRYLQRDLAPAMVAALAPGGLLFFSTWIEDGVRRHSLRPGELRAMFSPLDSLAYVEDEHDPAGPSASLAARRPLSMR
jgi:tellurite methyltransferase